MLLGRPWQFDRHVMHDGRANTYTLIKDGVKHKLKPLQEMNEIVCSATRVCVVEGKKFIDTMRCEHVCVFFKFLKMEKKKYKRCMQKLQICWKIFQILSQIMSLMDYH